LRLSTGFEADGPVPDSLAVLLRRTQGRYAQYFNSRKCRTGHLWQNRFYSCPMDERHLWAALRYVERIPVRAGLTPEAGTWAWSSGGGRSGACAGGRRKGPRFLNYLRKGAHDVL
jgi:hypothetical protein